MCGLLVVRMGFIGVLAPNVAVRRSKGQEVCAFSVLKMQKIDVFSSALSPSRRVRVGD